MDIPLTGKVVLYIIISLFGLFCVMLWGWQFMVLRGKPMKNPDGSVDDWHEQKLFYGIALADIVVAVPVALLGITLIFLNWQIGYFLTGLASFWYLWANTMTTATSLRFEKPKFTISWIVTFPFQVVLALSYLVWLLLYFEEIFGSTS
ncbi:hypothetical protein [Kaarinaea lacus]